MTCRISTASGEDETILRLEGRRDATGVNDLEEAVQAAPGTVLLDLSGLQSADDEGLRVLRYLSANGAKLVGASPYIRQLLDEKSS